MRIIIISFSLIISASNVKAEHFLTNLHLGIYMITFLDIKLKSSIDNFFISELNPSLNDELSISDINKIGANSDLKQISCFRTRTNLNNLSNYSAFSTYIGTNGHKYCLNKVSILGKRKANCNHPNYGLDIFKFFSKKVTSFNSFKYIMSEKRVVKLSLRNFIGSIKLF